MLQDWGDVYYFCGDDLRYCTCNFRWNALGWMKAVILWNFVLSAALGIQRLAIQVGLKGLLPGEPILRHSHTFKTPFVWHYQCNHLNASAWTSGGSMLLARLCINRSCNVLECA